MNFEVNSLVRAGLVKESTYIIERQHVQIYTANKKVDKEDLWGTDARLKECKGLVTNMQGTVMAMPFQRLPRFEDIAEFQSTFEPVIAVEKLDGFLASVFWVNSLRIIMVNGEISGKYVDMAKEYIDKIFPVGTLPRFIHATTMFEICHPDDSRVVVEEPGIFLIGQRWHGGNGFISSEKSLDLIAKMLSVRRPPWMGMRLNQAIQMAKRCRHEGYIIRNFKTGDPICTLQSPYYHGKKFLLEMGMGDVTSMYTNPDAFKKKILPEFHGFMYHLLLGFSAREWIGLCANDRRIVIEEYTWGDVE